MLSADSMIKTIRSFQKNDYETLLEYKIEYKSSVSRDLKQLDKKGAVRLLRELKEILSQNPTAGEPLHGEFKGLYKLRVGDYRVVYAMTTDTILVLRIRHRSIAYE